MPEFMDGLWGPGGIRMLRAFLLALMELSEIGPPSSLFVTPFVERPWQKCGLGRAKMRVKDLNSPHTEGERNETGRRQMPVDERSGSRGMNLDSRSRLEPDTQQRGTNVLNFQGPK